MARSLPAAWASSSAPDLEVALEEVLALSKLPPGLRAVDDHQVDDVEAERSQRSLDARLGLGVALDPGVDLGRDEEFVARDAAVAQAFADAALIAVGLGRVDVAVADLHRLPDGLRDLAIVDPPGAQAELGNADPIGERVGFTQHHSDLSAGSSVAGVTAARSARLRTAPP